MTNDTTNTTDTFGYEYPATGYDGEPTWAELYGDVIENIDDDLAQRLTEEEVEDTVAALLQAGDKLSLTYDDANDTLTLDTSALDEEEVEDAVADLITTSSGLTFNYDDANDTLTLGLATHATTHEKGGADELAVDGLSGDLADAQDPKTHSGTHEDGGGDELDVSGLSGVLADAQTPQTEAVQDIVGALVTGGTNVTVTYDDVGDVLTVDTSALNEEEVEDAVGALVTAGNAITVNYDDAADTLSIGVDESALSFYDGTNLTADVDNGSVNTGAATLTNGPTYEVLASVDNAAIPDITGLSGYYYVDLLIQGLYEGDNSGTGVEIRVNGVSTADYYNVYTDGTSETASQWNLATSLYTGNRYTGFVRVMSGSNTDKGPILIDAQGSSREPNDTEITEGHVTFDAQLDSLEFISSGGDPIAGNFTAIGAKY